MARKWLIALTVAALSSAALPATGHAKTHKAPFLQMSYVKHDVWDTQKTYEAQHDNWEQVEDVSTKCKRRSRNTIDCKTSMLFWSGEEGCVDAPGFARRLQLRPGREVRLLVGRGAPLLDHALPRRTGPLHRPGWGHVPRLV
jgi:hypothetical protein